MAIKKLIHKSISIVVSTSLIFQQTAFALSIVTDTAAPIANQATVKSAPNGVPVVNIVTPNQSGLSHNKFSDYNVNKEGLILNNANSKSVNTQLAGYIYGNKNLAAGNTAKIILNEVTSKNKSELRGYTEVAGDSARVIIANPNGIMLSGAGFINTPKATITTGTPNFSGNNLQGFNVDKGVVEIEGESLNFTNVDKAEIYAKVVKINTKINAKDIDIVTGENNIDLNGNVVKKENTTEDKVNTSDEENLSIDSSLLGGIYANKINLIGTQAGVGINLPVEITAQEELTLSADGKISLNKVIANKDLEIKSSSNDVSANLIYAQSVKIEAKNEIINNDIIASKTDINLKAKTITNKNLIASGVDEDLKELEKGNLNITSDKLENKNTLYAKDDLIINSKDVKSDDSSILKASNIIIVSENIEAKNTQINAGNKLDLVNSKKADLEDSTIQGNKLTISSDELILSSEKNSTDENKKDSNLVSSTTIDINANTIKNANGYMAANEEINITAKNIDNSNTIIVTNDNLNVNSQDEGVFKSVNSILQAKKKVELKINDFEGSGSTIQGELISIDSNNFNAKSTNILALSADLELNINNLNLNDSLLYSEKDISINSNKFISNYLDIQADNNINIDSSIIDLSNTSIQNVVKIDELYENGYEQGNINFISSNVKLDTVSLASNNLNLMNKDENKIDNLSINNSILDVNNNLNILSSVFNTSNSSYSALGELSLKANSIKDENNNNIFSNSTFTSAKSMNLSIDDDIVLDKSNSFESLDTITLNTKSLINSASFLSNDNITVNADNFIINNALLSSGNTITLNAENYIVNNDSDEALFGVRAAFTNINTNLLKNYGFISSLYEMNLKANDIENYSF